MGTWRYEWSNWPDGCIAFEKDGTYSASHIPGSPLVYYGTWSVKDNTVTIAEFCFNADFGTTSGPATYAFALDVSKYPRLEGKSNGSERVVLSNPKR